MGLKIEYLNKTELKPYANNAKVHTAEQVKQIKKSIREFGFNAQLKDIDNGSWKARWNND